MKEFKEPKWEEVVIRKVDGGFRVLLKSEPTAEGKYTVQDGNCDANGVMMRVARAFGLCSKWIEEKYF